MSTTLPGTGHDIHGKPFSAWRPDDRSWFAAPPPREWLRVIIDDGDDEAGAKARRLPRMWPAILKISAAQLRTSTAKFDFRSPHRGRHRRADHHFHVREVFTSSEELIGPRKSS